MPALRPQELFPATSSAGLARLPVRCCCCAARSLRVSLQTRGRQRSAQPGGRSVVCMGIKAVETYDGAFQLADSSEQHLKTLLSSKGFCDQVTGETGCQL